MKVGIICKLKVDCLGNKAGVLGVVFNDYGDGFQVIFENGNYDGFSTRRNLPSQMRTEDLIEADFFLEEVGFEESLAAYPFRNVMQVSADYRDGVFDIAWSERWKCFAKVFSSMPKPVPCPFDSPCVGEAKIHVDGDICFVHCVNCGRHTDTYKTEAEAVAAWNAVVKPKPEQPEQTEQTCLICGCEWSKPCEGGCYWVMPGICSKCVTEAVPECIDVLIDTILLTHQDEINHEHHGEATCSTCDLIGMARKIEAALRQ